MARGKNTVAPSTATAWLGPPPTVEDGFAFANGDFYAEASGQKRHRRATIAELKEHFFSENGTDRPAHWFEAQLIHYGLKPSKSKPVARMRLFNAVNAGSLSVPVRLAELESKLGKEWAKNERNARRGSQTDIRATGSAAAAAATHKAPKGKRKANDSTIATGHPPIPCDNKKIKTASSPDTPSKAPADPRGSAATRCAARASKSRGGGMVQGTGRGTSTRAPSSPRGREVRRGRVSRGSCRGALARVPSPASSSRSIQTARRSAPFVRGRIAAPTRALRCDDFDTSDNRIRTSDIDNASHSSDDDNDVASTAFSEDEDDNETFTEHGSLAPLTYINGRYALTCAYIRDNWPQYGTDFHLIFTISATTLWAAFKLGVLKGVMYFSELPSQSSYDPVPFQWRGRVADSGIMYGDMNSGWIKFLGDGRIEGYIDYHGVDFVGWRQAGPNAALLDAFTMQRMWDGYSEDEYERENEARWH